MEKVTALQICSGRVSENGCEWGSDELRKKWFKMRTIYCNMSQAIVKDHIADQSG